MHMATYNLMDQLIALIAKIKADIVALRAGGGGGGGGGALYIDGGTPASTYSGDVIYVDGGAP